MEHRREVEQEFMAKYEPVDYRSVTKIDFHKDVVRLPPRPEPMVGLFKLIQKSLILSIYNPLIKL